MRSYPQRQNVNNFFPCCFKLVYTLYSSTQRKKKTPSALPALHLFTCFSDRQHHITVLFHFILKPVKIFVPTSRERLFPNIKLTVTIRVWRLHLRIHILFPLSLSHALLFLVKRCHSGSNSVFFIDCWLHAPSNVVINPRFPWQRGFLCGATDREGGRDMLQGWTSSPGTCKQALWTLKKLLTWQRTWSN